MGLDMDLIGRKRLVRNYDNEAANRMEDNYRVRTIEIDLGYWRKHPNLHGYIVKTFAGGVDKCQKIPLDGPAIKMILAAIKENRLPETSGFFFGTSDGSQAERDEDTKIFQAALDWLTAITVPRLPEPELVGPLMIQRLSLDELEKIPTEYRSVIYQASW